MKPEEVDWVLNYFNKESPNMQQRRINLSFYPEEAVRGAAIEKGFTLRDDELSFVSKVLNESVKVWTLLSLAQKQRAEKRINQSINAMKRAYNLMLIMHNVMFYLGVALIFIGIISAFGGKEIAGIVLGGIGLANLMIFLIKEPIEGIHESIGNLMQIRSAYNSYFAQLEQWQLYYDSQHDEEHLEKKREIAKLIHQYTEATLVLIQDYCITPYTEEQKGKEV